MPTPTEIIDALKASTGLSEKELIALAIASLDGEASLEQKCSALKRALTNAEAFDERVTQEAASGGRISSEANEAHRFYTRVALIAVMAFLEAVGAGKRNAHPFTLWRLVKGLKELDDSGNVSPLFHSKLSGRPKPTSLTLAIRSVAAAQLELRFELQGRSGLDAAARAVAESMTFLGADAPTASAIKQWRGAVMGRPTNDEAAYYYNAALTFLRSQPDSPATQIERTHVALRWLTGAN